MSEPTFSQRIRDIADWLDSKVEIGSSSFDLAPGPVSQFDFELSEATHGLTMIAADLDRALAAPTAPAPTEPVAWRWKERDRFFDWTTDWSRHDKAIELGVEIEYAYATSPSAAASEATSSSDAEQFAKFFAMHAAELERNPYAYCELAYTRTTGWMAWITDKPLCGPVVSPDRKVLASGQGDTPAEAARAAINAAIATKGGKL